MTELTNQPNASPPSGLPERPFSRAGVRGKREQPRAIPEDVLNNWKINRQRGDVNDIRTYAAEEGKKISRQIIMNALRGFCTASVQELINDFYKNRDEKIIMLNSQPLT